MYLIAERHELDKKNTTSQLDIHRVDDLGLLTLYFCKISLTSSHFTCFCSVGYLLSLRNSLKIVPSSSPLPVGISP